MKLTKITSALSILMVFAVFLSSCSEEEILDSPTISGLEVGHNNSKEASPGEDLHIDAEIEAPANIDRIVVEIHGEEGQTWELEQTFTAGYAGAKNADFHEHIEIDAAAELGEYHFHLEVYDEAGNSTDVEADIMMVEGGGHIHIENLVVDYEAGSDELHIEADIEAEHGIASIIAEVDGSGYEEEFDVTGTANGEVDYSLSTHIDMSAAPSGHLDLHLKVTDLDGNVTEVEEHFDK